MHVVQKTRAANECSSMKKQSNTACLLLAVFYTSTRSHICQFQIFARWKCIVHCQTKLWSVLVGALSMHWLQCSRVEDFDILAYPTWLLSGQEYRVRIATIARRTLYCRQYYPFWYYSCVEPNWKLKAASSSCGRERVDQVERHIQADTLAEVGSSGLDEVISLHPAKYKTKHAKTL